MRGAPAAAPAAAAPVLGLRLLAESLGVGVDEQRDVGEHGSSLDVGQQQVGLGDRLLNDVVRDALPGLDRGLAVGDDCDVEGHALRATAPTGQPLALNNRLTV